MADTATTATVEVSDGNSIAMRFHKDGTDKYAPEVWCGPSDIGGLSSYSFLVQATTNALSVKASPGTVYAVHLGVTVDVVPAFLRFYDLAVAPTVGTSAIKRRIIIPGAAVTTIGARWDIMFGPHGLAFTSGIAIAVTKLIADTDATNVDNANRIVVEIDYL